MPVPERGTERCKYADSLVLSATSHRLILAFTSSFILRFYGESALPYLMLT